MIGLARGQIDPSARIGRNVEIGVNVTIGCNTIVYDNVSVGSGSVIGPHCILGEPTLQFYRDAGYENAPLTIGANAIIRAGSVLYAGSQIGDYFQTGPQVSIREGARFGRNCRVGTLCDIQGLCQVGDYCSFHSNVHIGQLSSIGNFVWIFPYVVLTNDPNPPVGPLIGVRIDDFAAVATMAVVLPGIHIGKDALVGAHALVRKDVPAEAVVVGNPARQICTIHDIKGRPDGKDVYPWREHFDRGMPWEGIGYRAWDERRKAGAVD
jgi:acetyltransferase-like isoleucine patch superfamily enzyme